MATTPKPKKAKTEDEPVDYLKDAPPERPYHEAISDEHRTFLESKGKAPKK